jgi:hypothetical protein
MTDGTFSGWMALTVNRGRLVVVRAAPDKPLGLECSCRLLFITWLAMGA